MIVMLSRNQVKATEAENLKETFFDSQRNFKTSVGGVFSV
jgi:hypothetical protein